MCVFGNFFFFFQLQRIDQHIWIILFPLQASTFIWSIVKLMDRFLLKFTGKDEEINLLGDGTERQEFGEWSWMSIEQLLNQVSKQLLPSFILLLQQFFINLYNHLNRLRNPGSLFMNKWWRSLVTSYLELWVMIFLSSRVKLNWSIEGVQIFLSIIPRTYTIRITGS